MKNHHFYEKFETIKPPEPPKVSHKAYLQKALRQAFYQDERITPPVFSQRPLLFKLWPAALVLIIGGFFLFNAFLPANRTTVQADAILQEAIQHIVDVSRQRGELLLPDTQLTLEILNNALKSHQARYVGEKVNANGQKITVLSFHDEAIADQISIFIYPYQDFAPGYQQNYSMYLVRLNFESQYAEEAAFDGFDSEIHDGKIVKFDELHQKLQDYKLQNNFADQLIRRQNLAMIAGWEDSLRQGRPICEEGMGGPDADQQKIFTRPGNLSDAEFLDQVRPVLINSNVLIGSLLCQHDLKGNMYHFSLSLEPLGQLREKKVAAREFLQQTLAKLSSDQSPQNLYKRRLLEKALMSPTLLKLSDRQISTGQFMTDEKGNKQKISKNMAAFSFQDKPCLASLENCTIIQILVDPHAVSWDDIVFDFGFWKGDENPAAIHLHAVLDYGVLMNASELLEKLRDHDPANDAIKKVTEYYNQENLTWLQDYGTPASKELADILKPVFDQSELAILHVEPEPNLELLPADQIAPYPTRNGINGITGVEIYAIPVYQLFAQ